MQAALLLMLLSATSWAGEALGVWKLNPARSTPGGNQKGVTLRIEPSANPVTIGGFISIYATGEVQTTPPGLDGAIAGSTPARQVLPVEVTVGGFTGPCSVRGWRSRASRRADAGECADSELGAARWICARGPSSGRSNQRSRCVDCGIGKLIGI